MSAVKKWRSGRDTLLYIVSLPDGTVEHIKEYGKKIGLKYKVAVIYDVKYPRQGEIAKEKGADIVLACDFTSDTKIAKCLEPIKGKLLGVTTRSDSNIRYFRKVIPHVPHLRTPSVDSLMWATNKIEMRKRFFAYDKSITPKFAIAKDSSQETVDKIGKRVGFPCVVKPPDLAESILVSICFHDEELQKALRKTFTKVKSVYKSKKIAEAPRVLVEQFMEGLMYSIDAYVSSRGKIEFTPMVYIKTGRDIGFDDFFGYQQLTPTNLKPTSIADAEKVAAKAIHALGLRSSTAHVELMRTEDGWKIIEVGPRIGGFRQTMYELSFGFNHDLNDILVRIPNKLQLSKRRKGWTAAMKFFAKEEGTLKAILGIKKARSLSSFHSIDLKTKTGSKLKFAKHGGRSVFNILLFNKDRSKLLADIRRLENAIKIKTVKKK